MNSDFGGDYGDMARAYYGTNEDDYINEKRMKAEQLREISERMYQRYVKDRLDDISHDDLIDEYGKEAAWFKERFEETERHYQAAMALQRKSA